MQHSTHFSNCPNSAIQCSTDQFFCLRCQCFSISKCAILTYAVDFCSLHLRFYFTGEWVSTCSSEISWSRFFSVNSLGEFFRAYKTRNVHWHSHTERRRFRNRIIASLLTNKQWLNVSFLRSVPSEPSSVFQFKQFRLPRKMHSNSMCSILIIVFQSGFIFINNKRIYCVHFWIHIFTACKLSAMRNNNMYRFDDAK